MRIKRLAIGLGILTWAISTCQAHTANLPNPSDPLAAKYDQEALSVALHWAEGNGTYYYGQPFEASLSITNSNIIPISFPQFYHGYYSWGFAVPNMVHLLDPTGQDLLRPYQRLDGWASLAGAKPIVAPAQHTTTLPLYVSRYLPSRLPGVYTLWVEMQDDFGILHRSNALRFNLVDFVSAFPADEVGLELRMTKPSYAPREPIHFQGTCSTGWW